jgi:hypothetical protein
VVTGTISWNELIWTASSLIGFVLHVWNFLDAATDRLYVAETGLNGGTKITTWKNVREAAGYGTIAFTFTLVGLYACSQPAPLVNKPVSTLGAMLAFAILLMNGLFVYLAVMNRIDRKRLVAYEQMALRDEEARIAAIQREVRGTEGTP